MEPRTCDAVLICPSLNLEMAAATLQEARDRAGMDCGVLLASDQARRGAVAANNVLITAAMEWGAQWIVYVNDDASRFPHGWLARLVEAVESRPEYGIAVPGCPCRTKPQSKGGPGLPPAIVELSKPSAWVVAVIKREMFIRLGMLNEDLYHYADDSDFEMRMFEAGFKSIYVQDVWVHHARHPEEQEASPWWQHDKATFRARWGRV